MGRKIEKKVSWGIIGCGDVCEIKSGPALSQIPHSELAAVMRRNPEKAADYAYRHKVPRWYSNADDLINDPDVNAIYIATPPNAHKEYALKAAAAGKPVYVEKPMAKTHAECLDMVAACQKANVPLFVAYYRRALPSILKIKELLQEGAIGEARFVNINIVMPADPDIVGAAKNEFNWRTNPEIAGGGYFYDLASHQLDAMDFIFGPIGEVRGIHSNQSGLYKADDIRVGAFKFKSGVLGTGTWAFNSGEVSSLEETTIVGSHGQISFSFFGDHSVVLERDNMPKEKFNFNISKHIQKPLIQSIVNSLLGKGDCPSTGVSAARTNWVMEQFLADHF